MIRTGGRGTGSVTEDWRVRLAWTAILPGLRWAGILAGVCAVAAQAAERPNVVLILADDMGFSDLGCYGGEVETPHLDALASEGLRFTQFYNTSKCFPSRACLLTGIYAQQAGMDRRPGRMRDAVTLAEVLRDAGYRTWMAGKHHGTENPFERGFERYFGLRDGACNYFNPGRQRPWEDAPAQKNAERAWCIDHVTYKPYTPPERDFYTTDYFTKAALSYLEEHGEDPAPFFLYLSYNAPHDPLQAWPRDIAKYRGRYRQGYQAVRAERWAKQKALGLFPEGVRLSAPEFPEWDSLTEEERDEEDLRMAVYAAMIECLDRNIGKVIAKLETMGERENTVILFASDNGASAEVVRRGSGPIGSMTRWESLGEDWANVSNTPFRKYKNFSLEGGITTPLIVSWPKGIEGGGRVIREPGHFIDLMPTVVDLGRARYPEVWKGSEVVPMQGTSLRPLFEGDDFTRGEALFWHWRGGKAVRFGKWKLVTHGGPWALYDLEVDRTEENDRAADFPGVRDRLASMWDAWAEEVTGE